MAADFPGSRLSPKSIYYICRMLFDVLNSEEMRVRINYYQVEYFGNGPFVWVRNNEEQIASIINPQQLISLMSPPLQFKERKCMFATLALFTSVVLVSTVAFIVYINKWPNSNESAFAMKMYAIVLPLLITLEGVTIWFWVSRFQSRLVDYVSRVNEKLRAEQSVQLYFPNLCCRGKNTSILAIRKCSEDALRLIPP